MQASASLCSTDTATAFVSPTLLNTFISDVKLRTQVYHFGLDWFECAHARNLAPCSVGLNCGLTQVGVDCVVGVEGACGCAGWVREGARGRRVEGWGVCVCTRFMCVCVCIRVIQGHANNHRPSHFIPRSPFPFT